MALVLLGVILFGCLGGIVATLVEPVQYQAEAYVVVYRMPTGFTTLISPDEANDINAIYEAGALQDRVLERIHARYPQYSIDAIRRAIQVKIVAYTPLTRITATATTADDAAQLANAVADQWTAVAGNSLKEAIETTTLALEVREADLSEKITVTQQQLAATDPASPVVPGLQAQLALWQNQLAKTESDIESLDVQRLYVAGNAWVANRATVENATKTPDLIKNIALGIAIGVSLSLMLALWLTARQWRRRETQHGQEPRKSAPPRLAREAIDA
jgi:capsular polysaccharide biosynthesis protein